MATDEGNEGGKGTINLNSSASALHGLSTLRVIVNSMESSSLRGNELSGARKRSQRLKGSLTPINNFPPLVRAVKAFWVGNWNNQQRSLAILVK